MTLQLQVTFKTKADLTGYRLPLRWYASTKSSIDHDISVAVLRLRLRHPVLDLWLLSLPVPQQRAVLWRLVLGWPAQCARTAIASELGHSRHTLCLLWFHLRDGHGHDSGRSDPGTRSSMAQYGVLVVVVHLRLFE